MAHPPASPPPPGQGSLDGDTEPGPDHVIAVQQLFIKHQSAVKAFILSLQPDFSEAEDILQEVFLVVTRKAGQFEPGTNFLAWALTIARLKVMEALRHSKKSEMTLSEEVIELLTSEPPEEGFFEVRFAAVRACLERLAPRMKEVMRLRYYEEHGPGEIARRLAWTANSVNVALSKARKQMHQCVGNQIKRG